MNISYRIKKLKVKWGRSKEKNLELDDFQEKAYNIVIKLINDKNSILIPDSINGRKGIKNGDIFVIIFKNYVSIMSGQYYYKDYIDDRTRDNIVDKFNSKLSRKINALENQSMNMIKQNLDSILQNIVNKK